MDEPFALSIPLNSVLLGALVFIIGAWIGSLLSLSRLSWFSSSKSKNDADLKIAASTKVPRHIGVIMDGNRRFGRLLHADPLKGHWAGGQTLIDFVEWCMKDGVEIVTVYAFSTENWEREAKEVDTLMTIFAKYAETFKVEAVNKNVKVKVLATDYSRLPPMVQQAVMELESATASCTGFIVNICLSYGGRAEIVSAAQKLTSQVLDGKLAVAEITEETFSNNLLTKDLPDPDILIRTSGEYRLSNFLIWQLAYTELFFVSKYWPELTHSDLIGIINEYGDRQRRFGK